MQKLNFDFFKKRLNIKSQTDTHLGQCEHCQKEMYEHHIIYNDGREVIKASGCECKARAEALRQFEEKKLKEYEQYSVMNADYKKKLVRDYKARNESQEIAKQMVVKFITNQEGALKKGQGMILFGTFGTGKTHLASAIRNALVKEKKRVLFISYPDYLEVIKQGFGSNGQADQRYTQISYKTQELAKNADLLILDDVGANNMTNWSKEQLFLLINSRINKSTIITTNYSIADFEKDRDLYRSFSRMAENSAIIEIKGEDLRRKDNDFNFG